MHDSRGAPHRVVGLDHDITNLEATELALRER